MSKRNITILSLALVILAVLMKTLLGDKGEGQELDLVDFLSGVLFGGGISFLIMSFIRRKPEN
jgi:hypothetical protein